MEDISMERWALWVVTALCVGILYLWLIDRIEERWPDNPYRWAEVVGGTILTLATLLWVIPWLYVIVAAGTFGLTGLPQVVGDMRRNYQRRSDKDAELVAARREIKRYQETYEGANQ